MSPATGPAASRRRLKAADVLGYALVAGSVWLAWEIIKVPVVERGAPALALKLSPTSPSVLTRAAEAELADKRYANAAELSDLALARAPFNARALRVRGLAEAQHDEVAADEMLTLAGNWSLRDDPTHSWLVQYRLRRGDYRSAFAHADALARRREDLHASIFPLFAAAATADPRTLAILVDLLAKNPPWRPAYFAEIQSDPKDVRTMIALAVALERGEGRLTDAELRHLYAVLSHRGQFAAVAYLRRELGRPAAAAVVNGGFEDDVDTQILPFGWHLVAGSGVSANVVEDDRRPGNFALRVQYDGFGSTAPTEQLLLLQPGRYRFAVNQRTETPDESGRLAWQIRCVEDARELLPRSLGPISDDWKRFNSGFVVPTGCQAQSLKLEPRPGDRRTTIASWADAVEITRDTAAQ